MKQRVRFGIDIRRQLTGADLYVRIFQICALLPLPYIFLSAVHPAVLSTRNLFSALFDLGMCSIPRTEAFAMAVLYRETLSEEAVYFIITGLAIVLGFAADRVIRGNPALSIRLHKAFAALICLDLAIRIIPVRANIIFGMPAEAAGFAVRALCLFLIVRDLKAHEKQNAAEVA